MLLYFFAFCNCYFFCARFLRRTRLYRSTFPYRPGKDSVSRLSRSRRDRDIPCSKTYARMSVASLRSSLLFGSCFSEATQGTAWLWFIKLPGVGSFTLCAAASSSPRSYDLSTGLSSGWDSPYARSRDQGACLRRFGEI